MTTRRVPGRLTEPPRLGEEEARMKYFARKFGFFLATLWAVVTLNFLIPRLQPGDPAEIMVKRLAGKDAAARPGAGRRRCGPCSARPTARCCQQYWHYLGELVHGNFGLSYTLLPVQGDRGDRPGVLVDGHPRHRRRRCSRSSVGVVLGAYAAWRRNTRFDSVVTLGLDVPRHAAAVLDRAAAALRLRLQPRLVPDLGRLRGVDAGLQLAASSRRRSRTRSCRPWPCSSSRRSAGSSACATR